MATVYKVEIEVVSDWVNFSPEQIEDIIFKAVNVETVLAVGEIKAERK